jgi:DNA-binding response OmpR family regulator
MHILIIEDNNILRRNIEKYFSLQWFTTDTHDIYTGASYKIMTWSYDLILLDLGLWKWENDGIEICKDVRNKWNTIPILMLTAHTLTSQKIEWLEAWADDYLTKPFDYGELIARVTALTRRWKTHKGNILQYQNIQIHKESMQVKQDDLIIKLSKLEYNLLLFILENTGVVLKKELLLEKVWGDRDMFDHSRKLDIYIGYLRKKLGSDFIETVHGVGYIIK